MRIQSIHYKRTVPALCMALALFCFAPSQAIQANENHNHSIVGLWQVTYYHDTTPFRKSYDQWHDDGQEFEVANGFPGMQCQGTWKRMHGVVSLFHVGWLFDDSGQFAGHFEETQTNTVGSDGTTYTGTFDQKFYDANGNFTGEDMGTVQATRLTVP
jgi:hypothetical protein